MKVAALFVAGVVALVASPALAGFPGEVPDRFQLTFGGVFATMDTQAGAGGVRGGIGATIVFEDLFDIPIGQQTAFATGSWRFGDRSYLDFGGLGIDRSGAHVLAEDVTFKGYTFQAGSNVTGDITTRFPYAAYRYDFLQTEQVKISGSAGISYMALGASLTADGGILDPDGNVIEEYTTVGTDINMPVPLFGLQLDWAVSKRNSIVYYGRLMYVDYSGLRASVGEQSIHWYFHAWKHFAVGAGIDKISIDIPKYEKDDRFATFKFQLSGATIYGKLSF